MTLLKGKQIATGSDGVANINLSASILTADNIGRALIAQGFFDNPTITSSFQTGSMPINILAQQPLTTDGTLVMSGNLQMGGFRITGLANGINATDAVTYQQLTSAQAGLDVKLSCQAATTSSLPSYVRNGNAISGTITGGLLGQIDDYSPNSGDRILLKNGASGFDNGIYDVVSTGSSGSFWFLTRSADSNTSAEVTNGMFTFITFGTINAETGWVLVTPDPITLNGEALTFSQFNGATSALAGLGLYSLGSTVNVGQGQGIFTSGSFTNVAFGSGSDVSNILLDTTASSPGVKNAAARVDHVHMILSGVPLGLSSSNVLGTSSNFSRADHRHKRDTWIQEKITIQDVNGGDTILTGTLSQQPPQTSSVELHLNGLYQEQGPLLDYRIVSGTQILWLRGTGTAVKLKASSDELYAYYFAEL